MRDRSSSDLSLRFGSFQRRISSRMALLAFSAIAGLKLMKNFPFFEFFERLGRNVYPRNLNFS